MSIFCSDLRRGTRFLLIWSFSIAFMLGVCVLIYPEMTSQMTEISDMFSDMGSFSSAFGLDSINFGEFMGYFAVECGNLIGLGGAIFAALIGAMAISGEEKSGTAEFLFSHPVSRSRIVFEKLFSVSVQILILNLIALAVSVVCILMIGVEAEYFKILVIFFAYFMMQLQICFLSFCVSSFLSGAGVGISLGLAFGMYFLNILSNLNDQVSMLKYLTPFGYTDSGYIVNNGCFQIKYFIVSFVFMCIVLFLIFRQYSKKDL